MIRVLIPAAGLGTRMGMAINESKELLINPETNKCHIQYHLDLCKKHNLSPLIITRVEKQDLIKYCTDRSIELFILNPEKPLEEWPTTLLRAQEFWGEKNILLLPDTVFSDETVLENIKMDLNKGLHLVAATHSVENVSKWGCVRDRDYFTCFIEKPKNQKSGRAWGILGFNKQTGVELLTSFKNKEVYKKDIGVKLYKLKWFKDLTRGF